LFDVPRLGRLGAAAEQEDEASTSPAEVDAVAWAVIDAQLVEAATEGVGDTEVAEAQARQANSDAGSGSSVSQATQPLRERRTAFLRLVYLDLQWSRFCHGTNVAGKPHHGKQQVGGGRSVMGFANMGST
jgi:hypothetical protein